MLDNLTGETPANYFARFKWVVDAARRDEYFRGCPTENIAAVGNPSVALKEMQEINDYTTLCMLLMDTNLIENAIRPIALGRNNYLFAGSHQAAQNAAMIYSLMATCKLHDVNAYDWLKYVLAVIPTFPAAKLKELLPQNWKATIT